MSNRKAPSHTQGLHVYGWRPDLPDQRDVMYAAPPHVLQSLPPSVDLRLNCPPVYDQGQLGSCTGNAIAGAHEFDQIKQAEPAPWTPSRLFIYFNERTMEGTVGQDAGAQIRDGIKSIAKWGVPSETLWPYNIGRFTTKPPATAFTEALKHQAVTYARVPQNLDQIRACLAQGFPIVFGFTVYESFESAAVARTGIMPLPGAGESVLGGHAVLAVGYNDAKRWIIVRNSWGDGWGDKGYFYMPYDFITNNGVADDFWKVTRIE